MNSISSNYALQLVGGHNVCSKKPLISFDNKLILIPSFNSIRIHFLETGLLFHSLHSQNYLSDEEEILIIQLDPLLMDSSVISFSSHRNVIFWNYLEGVQVKSFILCPSLPSDSLLCFGVAVLHESSSQDALTYYFALKKQCQLQMIFSNDDSQNVTDLGIKINQRHALIGVTFGASNTFVAAFKGNTIRVLTLPYKPSNKIISHSIAKQEFTCITSHQTEYLLAAGDTLGRIFIYREDFTHNLHPIRTVVHWHSFAVSDLTFSRSAAYLYSVGKESVLVRWDVSRSHENTYLPRLGAPLKYIICDRHNEGVILTHENNSVKFVSSTMSEHRPIIGGLNFTSHSDDSEFDGHLDWNSKCFCIVLKGEYGHLQFYSLILQKQINQLDVLDRNFIASPNEKIIHVEISNFAVSPCGQWIATIEMRDDNVTLIEMRLKFFEFNKSAKQKYSLNICLHLPHKSKVNDIKFSNNSQLLITSSMDGEFKLWTLVQNSDDSKRFFWTKGQIGVLNRCAIPNVISCSLDSSILAISCDALTTLWDISDVNALKYRERLLPDQADNSSIIALNFGSQNKSSCILETRNRSLRVWDLLDLSVIKQWSPSKALKITLSIFDSLNNRAFVYLSDKKISIFYLDHDVPVMNISYSTGNLKKGQILSGLIVSQKYPSKDEIFTNTALCLLDSNHQLTALGLSHSQEAHFNTENDLEEETKLTKFAKMLLDAKKKATAEQAIKEIEMEKYFSSQIDSKKLVEELFINTPSHVLPPIETLSKKFLSSLLIQTTEDNEDNFNEYNKLDPNLIESEEEDDEESQEVDMKDLTKPAPTPFLTKPDLSNFTFDENYTWLTL